MPALQKLISFHIIEKDTTNKWLMSWTYPTISDQNKAVILQKLDTNSCNKFTYMRNKNDWIYLINTENFDNDNLEDIKQFCLVIIASDFHPAKYENFGRILSKLYIRTGNPVELVKLYLTVFTTGQCSTQDNGSFMIKDFDNGCSNSTKIKELIKMFGLEIILLYTAILLKKRVILYHHSQETLLKLMPTITALMPHRNLNNYIFPQMEVTSDSLSELKTSNYFVAGFKDNSIFSKTDIFDIFVNLPATEITIMTHAKESLTMTKTHKDIAIFMVQLAENPELSESEIIKEISNKTQELLSYLKGLTSEKGSEHLKLTVQDIKTKNLHVSVENFLLNLATAENLLSF